jgi:small subunit ribosomal protein S16
VAVKIKLKRLGKIRAPYYRIVVADARTKRDGRAIEEIGKYHPKAEPSFIEVNSERAQHWLSVGAQPTDPVRKILEITGDWQKYKGLPGTEGTLRTAEPKAEKSVAFAAALQETLDAGGSTTKPKTRAKAGDAPAAKTAKADKPEKAEKAADKPEKAEKAETKPEKAEKAADKPEKAEKAADKPEKADKAEKPADQADKPDKAEKPADQAEKAESAEKADKPAKAAATAEAPAEATAGDSASSEG